MLLGETRKFVWFGSVPPPFFLSPEAVSGLLIAFGGAGLYSCPVIVCKDFSCLQIVQSSFRKYFSCTEKPICVLLWNYNTSLVFAVLRFHCHCTIFHMYNFYYYL